MAGSNGEDRVVATAHHILSTLSSSQTEDMLRILSTFDDRFMRFGIAAESHPAHSDFGLDRANVENVPADQASDHIEELLLPLQSAQDIIMQWDFGFSPSAHAAYLWLDHRDQVAGYLDAVDTVQSFLESLPPTELGSSSAFDHAQNLLQFAMMRLEAEFCHLLEVHSEPADPEWLFDLVSSRSSFSAGINSGRSDEGCGYNGFHDHDDDNTTVDSKKKEDGTEEEVAKSRALMDMTIDMLPSEAVSDLCDIATRMVQSGYETECTQVYVATRKPILEESMQKLGQEKLTFEDVQRMAWELLEAEIGKWIQAVKIAIAGLLPSERQICEKVFHESPSISSSCFSDVAKGTLLQLLNFAEAVAISRRAPEKLFKILDMYEVLRDMLPSIESIFAGESCASLMSEASEVLGRLGDAARGTFVEFELAMQRETSKNPVPGGAVHPLARYVMNYMRFLSDYADTLNQLLMEKNDASMGDVNKKSMDPSPLSSATLRLMELLEKNLDAKSKLYKDPALSYLFLMNNVHYVGQKVKDSEVRKLLGDEWIKRNNGKLRQYHTNYRRTAWTKVLSCLKDEGINITGSSSNAASRNILKDRFKAFNAALDETVKTQSSWIVSDPQLCTELRISITEMLLPAYRSFLGRYQNHLDVRHPEKYVKYTPEDLEAFLNDLFEGTSGSMTKR